MRAAVALLLSLSISQAACFPQNSRHRTYAKVTEGTMIAAGIAMLAVTNTGADCDANGGGLGGPQNDCKSESSLVGGVGLALIVLGMVGFAATVTTAPDDPPPTSPLNPTQPPGPPKSSPGPAPSVPTVPGPTGR